MRRRLLKVIGGLAAAILIGAIGSGVWEALLKPLFQYGAEVIVGLFAWMSTAFKDSVYREAAEGFHEKHSLALIMFVYGVIAGAITGIPIIWPLRGWIKKKIRAKAEALETTPEVTTRQLFIAAVGILSIVALGMFVTARESYVNRIATWSLTSIERLNSSVSPSEYAVFKAIYYRINGANDFYAFHSLLKKAAHEKGVKLREFDPL
jgi:hypothetical protein